MKLASAHQLSLLDSTLVGSLPILNEAGEAPRWSFNYDNYKQDPAPDILVLGAYRHPNTGNNLVGGINLNYLDKTQRDNLARVLPKLMQQSNLYQRYHLGKQLLPGVFDNSYRTYNAAHIRGVNQGVFNPKYGMMQATTDFLKKKVGGLFKSKDQRAKEAEPKFPSDLTGMKDSLDQAVHQLGLQVAKGEAEPDTPEMAAARQNFTQFKLDRAKSMADVEAEEDEPFVQATQNLQQAQLQQGQATPQQVGPYAAQQYQSVPTPQPAAPPAAPQQSKHTFEQERAESQRELTDPNNSLDLDGDGIPDDQQPPKTQFEESVAYYCPLLKTYIIEDLGTAIREFEEFDSRGFSHRSNDNYPDEEEVVDEPETIPWAKCTPDSIWWSDPKAVVFVYTSDGLLYTNDEDSGNNTHNDIFDQYPELVERYGNPSIDRVHAVAQRTDLLGRAGKVMSLGIRVVSFWNSNPEIYQDLLPGCLETLTSEGIIGSGYLVSIPGMGAVTQAEALEKFEQPQQQSQQQTPRQRETDEEVELYRQLHLMRGPEKQAAMKKLGVGVGGRPHPMATAMTKAGLLKAGQKWWAPTSEGILREPSDSEP